VDSTKGGEIDFSEPEMELIKLSERYNIVEVAFDPYQLHSMAQRLREEGINMKAFSQGSERLIADKSLYDAIRDRKILHSGEAEVAEHITNANAKTDGDKLRLIKKADHLKIDLAVALSMARYRLMKLHGQG